jgi:hypothetical protein
MIIQWFGPGYQYLAASKGELKFIVSFKVLGRESGEILSIIIARQVSKFIGRGKS